MMQTEPLSMTQSANRRIRSFRQRFGDGHFYLACHAALPLALTPDLLYRLWATFQRDCQDDDLAMPWIAVSDLLLSGLCDEVGDELYEMDSTVRDALMQQLKDSPRLGLARVRELAEFVIAYIDPQRASADLDTRDFAQAQHWRALAYQQPQKAVQAIATTLAELSFDETHEWMRMAALVETLEDPLEEFPELLVYVEAIDDFVRGNDRSAIDKLKQLADENQQIQIADVDLPIPVAIQREDSKNKPISSKRKTSPIDIIRQYSYWLIGGSVLATMTLGGVIFYNSQVVRSPQPTPSRVSSEANKSNWSLESCSRYKSNSNFICYLSISIDGDRFAIKSSSTRLIDNKGKEYPLQSIRVGTRNVKANEEDTFFKSTEGIPNQVSLYFVKIPYQVSQELSLSVSITSKMITSDGTEKNFGSGFILDILPEQLRFSR